MDVEASAKPGRTGEASAALAALEATAAVEEAEEAAEAEAEAEAAAASEDNTAAAVPSLTADVAGGVAATGGCQGKLGRALGRALRALRGAWALACVSIDYTLLATIAKILLFYGQALSPFRRYEYPAWPPPPLPTHLLYLPPYLPT